MHKLNSKLHNSPITRCYHYTSSHAYSASFTRNYTNNIQTHISSFLSAGNWMVCNIWKCVKSRSCGIKAWVSERNPVHTESARVRTGTQPTHTQETWQSWLFRFTLLANWFHSSEVIHLRVGMHKTFFEPKKINLFLSNIWSVLHKNFFH